MDYSDYLNTPHWQATRRRKLDTVGNQCEKCGRPGMVDVHHLTYERVGKERMSDLQVLCPLCHVKAHGNEPTLEDYERCTELTFDETFKKVTLRLRSIKTPF